MALWPMVAQQDEQTCDREVGKIGKQSGVLTMEKGRLEMSWWGQVRKTTEVNMLSSPGRDGVQLPGAYSDRFNPQT